MGPNQQPRLSLQPLGNVPLHRVPVGALGWWFSGRRIRLQTRRTGVQSVSVREGSVGRPPGRTQSRTARAPLVLGQRYAVVLIELNAFIQQQPTLFAFRVRTAIAVRTLYQTF